MTLYGALETGGTKTILLVASSVDEVVERLTIESSDPAAVINGVEVFFDRYPEVAAYGIGSFGPLNLKSSSLDYGRIQRTPKEGWEGINFRKLLQARYHKPVAIESDVNAAALAELKLGAGRRIERDGSFGRVSLDNFIYVTVGTGIGACAMINQRPVHGLTHPEMGHYEVPRHPADDAFASVCPFHKDCLEGVASGVAISKRWGASLNNLGPEHSAWFLEGHYLASFCNTLITMYSPERIVFGGGVPSEPLLTIVRNKLFHSLNNYISDIDQESFLKDYVMLSQVENDAGPMGALLLAIQAGEQAGA